MKAFFPRRWTFLKVATTFTTKVCIKYWKQGHYYSFSSTIDWSILTQIHLTEYTFFPFYAIIIFLVWALQCADTRILYFFAHEKTNFKSRVLLRICRNFQCCQKNWPGLPRWVENTNSFFNVSYTWYKSLICHKVTHSLNDEKELEQFHRNWTKNWSNQGPSEKKFQRKITKSSEK